MPAGKLSLPQHDEVGRLTRAVEAASIIVAWSLVAGHVVRFAAIPGMIRWWLPLAVIAAAGAADFILRPQCPGSPRLAGSQWAPRSSLFQTPRRSMASSRRFASPGSTISELKRWFSPRGLELGKRQVVPGIRQGSSRRGPSAAAVRQHRGDQ
jgi:hypothetical protein